MCSALCLVSRLCVRLRRQLEEFQCFPCDGGRFFSEGFDAVLCGAFFFATAQLWETSLKFSGALDWLARRGRAFGVRRGLDCECVRRIHASGLLGVAAAFNS